MIPVPDAMTPLWKRCLTVLILGMGLSAHSAIRAEAGGCGADRDVGILGGRLHLEPPGRREGRQGGLRFEGSANEPARRHRTERCRGFGRRFRVRQLEGRSADRRSVILVFDAAVERRRIREFGT